MSSGFGGQITDRIGRESRTHADSQARRLHPRALVVAVVGAWLILAIETWGEIRLGVSGEQSNMTVLFALYTLCAAFVEEVVFRGFIVIDGKGVAVRWVSIFAASLLFAALHPFLW